jgi:predicted nucleic acid-binding protein
VDEVLLNGGIGLLSLYSDEMETVISASQQFGLDFDDAYQYTVAARHGLDLVSFDTDFQRTDKGHRTPSDVLQSIQ